MTENENTFTIIITKDKSIKVNGQIVQAADTSSNRITVSLSSEIPITLKLGDTSLKSDDNSEGTFTMIDIPPAHVHNNPGGPWTSPHKPNPGPGGGPGFPYPPKKS